MSTCVLSEALITIGLMNGQRKNHTLPGVMAALVSEQVTSFPRLRPHQRHVWHAVLVQLAAIALQNAGLDHLPEDETVWRNLLRALTPQWPKDEPWHLISVNAETPALLQAPVPGGNLSGFKILPTPDALDMLVIAKNHDLKVQRMWDAAPEEWLFALVSLQTQEGSMGLGKYGGSRMNGGYGSRSSFMLDFDCDLGLSFRRDVSLLLAPHQDGLCPLELKPDGLALTWLEPWDGASQLQFKDLHPFYIEICRRVRLVCTEGRIIALETRSVAPRITGAGELKGNTGDPWMPVDRDGKALLVDKSGFSYKKMLELLMGDKYTLPILAKLSGNDPAGQTALVARAVCRGQGKTEGYHDQRIILPADIRPLLTADPERITKPAQRRLKAIGELKQALRFGMFILSQGAPHKLASDRETTKKFVEPWLSRFERDTERTFFTELWLEVLAGESHAKTIYKTWLQKQRARGQKLLHDAIAAMPHPLARSYRAKSQAETAFWGRLSKSEAFAPLKSKAAEGAHADVQ